MITSGISMGSSYRLYEWFSIKFSSCMSAGEKQMYFSRELGIDFFDNMG